MIYLIGLLIYVVLMFLFLVFWKSAHYRTPYEEARDIEEEAQYWIDESIRKKEFQEYRNEHSISLKKALSIIGRKINQKWKNQ